MFTPIANVSVAINTYSKIGEKKEKNKLVKRVRERRGELGERERVKLI